MSITIYTGIPGSGKSLKLAQTVLDILYKNKKWYERSGVRRQIVSNLRLSGFIHDEYFDFIRYWQDPAELVDLKNVDVIWDEIATHLDSTQWANVPLELKRWLQQHRKLGVDIYGTTQDFSMVDISMRRLTSDLWWLTKLFGSRDPSPTRPPIKTVWGLIMASQLDPLTYTADPLAKNKRTSWPSFFFITKQLVDVYDTSQQIVSGKYPPLRHVERDCADSSCDFHKVLHF